MLVDEPSTGRERQDPGDGTTCARQDPKEDRVRDLSERIRSGTHITDLLFELARRSVVEVAFDEQDLAAAINVTDTPECLFLALAEAINGGVHSYMLEAATVCGHLKTAPSAIVKAMTRALGLLRWPHEKSRRAIAKAFGNMLVHTPEELGALVATLRDSDPEAVGEAAAALERIAGSFPVEVGAALRAQPDVSEFRRLVKEYQGGDAEAGERAFADLIRLGAPIRNILARGIKSGSYSPDDFLGVIAAVISDAGPTNPDVYRGLAQAIVGPTANIRELAIYVCGQITTPHPILIDALVHTLYDRNDRNRIDSVRAMKALYSRAPGDLNGLVVALSHSDCQIVEQAIFALGQIGIGTVAMIDPLLVHLEDPNSWLCGCSIVLLNKIMVFDRRVFDRIQRIATSEFHCETPEPERYGDDDYWSEYRSRVKKIFESNRSEAAELLTKIPIAALVSPIPNPPPSAEDRRILGWFAELERIEDYLPLMQVFWCIGLADRGALQATEIATGYDRLSKSLAQMNPRVSLMPLHIGITYFRQACRKSLPALFDRKPFSPEAWTDAEATAAFWVPQQEGRLTRNRWTARARKAWHYTDRYLRLNGLLPTITEKSGT